MRTEHIAVSSETAEGVLRELGRHAVERGYATEGYVEALLSREADFPTGLAVPTAPVDVAIPHADPEHVRESAVVLALPETPVPFRDMDDPEGTVEAGVVMLLLADESDGYTAFLSNLANLFQNPGFADAVRADDHERILALVEEECLSSP
jgi:PTS system galactitol-specific IIA component